MIDISIKNEEVSMPTKRVSVLPVRAAQTNLFRPPNQESLTWPRMPDAVTTRVVEALAQLLLCASGAASGSAEAVDD